MIVHPTTCVFTNDNVLLEFMGMPLIDFHIHRNIHLFVHSYLPTKHIVIFHMKFWHFTGDHVPVNGHFRGVPVKPPERFLGKRPELVRCVFPWFWWESQCHLFFLRFSWYVAHNDIGVEFFPVYIWMPWHMAPAEFTRWCSPDVSRVHQKPFDEKCPSSVPCRSKPARPLPRSNRAGRRKDTGRGKTGQGGQWRSFHSHGGYPKNARWRVFVNGKIPEMDDDDWGSPMTLETSI